MSCQVFILICPSLQFVNGSDSVLRTCLKWKMFSDSFFQNFCFALIIYHGQDKNLYIKYHRKKKWMNGVDFYWTTHFTLTFCFPRTVHKTCLYSSFQSPQIAIILQFLQFWHCQKDLNIWCHLSDITYGTRYHICIRVLLRGVNCHGSKWIDYFEADLATVAYNFY